MPVVVERNRPPRNGGVVVLTTSGPAEPLQLLPYAVTSLGQVDVSRATPADNWPPAKSNWPATTTSPVVSMASPSAAPSSPPPTGVQVLPFQRPMLARGTPPACSNFPPARTSPPGSLSRVYIAGLLPLGLPATLFHEVPL